MSDASAQSFATILGNQRTQQSSPVPEYRSTASTPAPSSAPSQSTSGSTQQSSSSASPQASASSAQQASSNNSAATQQASSGSNPGTQQASSESQAPSGQGTGSDQATSDSAGQTQAGKPADKQAATDTTEPLAANPTAMAMSDLAAAVAQVFMARNAAADNAATPDSTGSLPDSKTIKPEPLLAAGMGQDQKGAKDGRFTEARLQAGQQVATDAKPLADSTVQGRDRVAPNIAERANPQAAANLRPATDTDAETDPVLAAQATRDSRTEKSAASIASLNQRADSLDREARLNANARIALEQAAPANPRALDGGSDARVFSPLSDNNVANDARLNAGITSASAPFSRDAALPLANGTGATPLTEASIGLASGNVSFAPGSMTSPMVSTPLGHPKWGNDFSQQVAGFSQNLKNGLQTIEMRLDPPDLGPIRISLSLTDGVAQAMFISPHASVRNAVENALPQLQQQLAQAGISLGQTSVSDQGQAGQQTGENNQAGRASNNSLASQGAVAENALPEPQARPKNAHNGQISTFA